MTKEIRRRLNDLGRVVSGCFIDACKEMVHRNKKEKNKEKESRTFD